MSEHTEQMADSLFRAVELEQGRAFISDGMGNLPCTEILRDAKKSLRHSRNVVRILEDWIQKAEGEEGTMKPNSPIPEKLREFVKDGPNSVDPDTLTEAAEEIDRLRAERDQASEYLARLLKAVYPSIEPLDSLAGLCTQVDNGFAVVLKSSTAPAAEFPLPKTGAESNPSRPFSAEAQVKIDELEKHIEYITSHHTARFVVNQQKRIAELESELTALRSLVPRD